MSFRAKGSAGALRLACSMLVVAGALSGALSATGGRAAAATAPCPSIYVTNSPKQGIIPTVAEFAAGANGNVAPVNSIGGPRNTLLLTETGIVQDANGFTYVGNGNTTTITVYAPGASGDVKPVSTLSGSNTGLTRPEGMVIQNGKLYVADGPTPPGTDPSARPPSSVFVYDLPLAPGANNLKPVQTITGPATGLFQAVGLALDPAGHIFVANLDFSNHSSVTEYAPGANGNVAPIATLAGPNTLLSGPEGLAIRGNRLYVANDSNVVTEYSVPLPAGTDNIAPVAKISGANTGLAAPIGLAFDAAGDLYVVNLVEQNSPAPTVTEYAPGASGNATPIATITGSATTLNNPQFVFIAPCSTGTVTVGSISPAKLGQGATNIAVKVNGSGFQPGAAVTISSAGITVGTVAVTSANLITAHVDVAAGASPGPADLTVTNSDGSRATCRGCLTIDPAPTVTSSSPRSVSRGSSSVVLTVAGTNFTSGAKATFSGSGITVTGTTFVNSSTLRVTVDVASTATTGPHTIIVTNKDKGRGRCAGCFTVI